MNGILVGGDDDKEADGAAEEEDSGQTGGKLEVINRCCHEFSLSLSPHGLRCSTQYDDMENTVRTASSFMYSSKIWK